MNRFTVTLAATAMIAGIVAPAVAQNDIEGRSIALGKLLNTRLPQVDFNGHEFRTCVTFLSDIAGLDILAKWDEQGFGDGLDPNRKITLHLKNPTPLVTILELVMKQGSDDETSWVLGDGYVEVGTKDQLNKNKYVRIYPVRELLFTAPRFDNAPELDLESVLQSTQQGGSGGGSGSSGSIFKDENDTSQNVGRANEGDQATELIDIITSIVEPNQWESLGGEGGSIRYFRGNLIINAADYLHRQVGGYPFAPARIRNSGSVTGSAYAPSGTNRSLGLARVIPQPRYVTLTGDFGFAQLVDVRETSIPVLVGGRVFQSDGRR